MRRVFAFFLSYERFRFQSFFSPAAANASRWADDFNPTGKIFMSDIDTMAFDQVLIGVADQEIVNLEARIRAAQLSADVTALNDLISDDLLFTGPDGQLGTKTQDIDAYRSGTVKFITHVPEELRIRRVGTNVAISSLRAQLTTDVAGNISHGTYRYTRVWARENDQKWRVVGGHVSLVHSVEGDE